MLINGGRSSNTNTSLTDDSLIDCLSVDCLECCFPILCDHHWFYSTAMSSEYCLSHPSLRGVPCGDGVAVSPR